MIPPSSPPQAYSTAPLMMLHVVKGTAVSYSSSEVMDESCSSDSPRGGGAFGEDQSDLESPSAEEASSGLHIFNLNLEQENASTDTELVKNQAVMILSLQEQLSTSLAAEATLRGQLFSSQAAEATRREKLLSSQSAEATLQEQLLSWQVAEATRRDQLLSLQAALYEQVQSSHAAEANLQEQLNLAQLTEFTLQENLISSEAAEATLQELLAELRVLQAATSEERDVAVETSLQLQVQVYALEGDARSFQSRMEDLDDSKIRLEDRVGQLEEAVQQLSSSYSQLSEAYTQLLQVYSQLSESAAHLSIVNAQLSRFTDGLEDSLHGLILALGLGGSKVVAELLPPPSATAIKLVPGLREVMPQALHLATLEACQEGLLNLTYRTLVEGIPYDGFRIKVISDEVQPLWTLDVAAAEADAAGAAESGAEAESEASLEDNMAAAYSSMSAFLDDYS